MIGRQDRSQETLFIAGSLYQLVPEDHILKRVDKVLDLSWLRDEVRECYDETTGRPSIDPEAAVRLMLAGFFEGIVHDRKLMQQAEVNVAIRWFAGYELQERLPDHSSLTRIRQRWGEDRFRRVFEKTVESCMRAGLVGGEMIHADATLIRADVSWGSLTTEHIDQVLEANQPEDDPEDGGGGKAKQGGGRESTKRGKKRSTTDPDCTMATSKKTEKLQPCYKQHTAVDDKSGVIVDVELTTGEVNEGKKLLEVVERVEAAMGMKVEYVTADGAYGHSANYGACEERGTVAVIPPQPEPKNPKRMPLRRFRFDARNNIVRCPAGRALRPKYRVKNGWIYKAQLCDCQQCVHQSPCVSPGKKTRTVLIVEKYPALLRARRWWATRDEETKERYRRHQWQVEGKHGVGKTQHGLRRAVRRGQWNVAIQVYLTAAVMNLKRLAASFWLFLWLRRCQKSQSGLVVELRSDSDRFLRSQTETASELDAAA